MDKFNEVAFVLEEIEKFLDTINIDSWLNESHEYLISFKGNANIRYSNIIHKFYIDILNSFRDFNTLLWNPEEINILKSLGVADILGDSKYLDSLKDAFSHPTSHEVIPAIEEIHKQITNLFNLIAFKHSFYDLLNENYVHKNKLDQGKALIEIIFDNNVVINDFKDAKVQMNNWYLIIEGYARLLNVTREEFEIIAFSKNSPTKVQVITSLEVAKVILEITTVIILAYQGYLINQKTIEGLEKSNLLTDKTFKAKVVEQSTKQNSNEIDEKIAKIVSEKIALYHKGNDTEEVQTIVTRSVKKQFNFTVNGGEVNLHFEGDNYKEEVLALEKDKNEVKLLKEGLSNQLYIEETTSESDDLEDEVVAE